MPNCKETKGRGFAAPSEPEAPPTFRVRAFHPILCCLPLCISTQRFRSEVNHQILQILSVTLLERILLSQVLIETNYKYERVEVHNQLVLFDL